MPGHAELIQESACLRTGFICRLHHREDTASACARDRDVQQSAFLGQELSGRHGRPYPNWRQPVGFKHTPTRAQIWPLAFLQADDPHAVPLLALCPMGRQDAHHIAVDGAFSNGFSRQLLATQGQQEIAQSLKSAKAMRIALRRVEQGHHRIEIVICRRRALQRGAAQSIWPCMCATVTSDCTCPQDPQHLGRGSACGQLLMRGLEQAAQAVNCGCGIGQPLTWRTRHSALQHLADQLISWRRRAGRMLVASSRTQGPAKLAQLGDVQPAQRTGEQLGSLRSRDARQVQRGLCGQQQRAYGRLQTKRELICGDDGRHAGLTQPPQHRCHVRTAAGQHRHLRPRHLAVQMPLTHLVGDAGSAGQLAVIAADADGLGLVLRFRGRGMPMPIHDVAGQAAQGDRLNDLGGRLTNGSPEASGCPEHHDRSGIGGRAEAGREVQQCTRISTAECVDRLIGVTDGDHGRARAHECVQERDLQGVSVLILVDGDEAKALPRIGV